MAVPDKLPEVFAQHYDALFVALKEADPHIYLADVLNKIVNGHPNSAIDDLLPHRPAARAAGVGGRRKERFDQLPFFVG